MLDEVMLNKFRNLYNDVLEDIKNYSFNSSIKQIELNSKLKNDINNVKRKYIVLDRIEEDVAVCEVIGENKMIGIKKSKLPLNVKEGNVLKFDSLLLALYLDNIIPNCLFIAICIALSGPVGSLYKELFDSLLTGVRLE